MKGEIEEIGTEASYRYMTEGDGAVITRCIARGERVAVPAQLGGHRVTALGQECFASAERGGVSMQAFNGQLEIVELPEGLERIGRAAFRGCSRLARVTLPESLVEIDDLAFSCTAVTRLRLPKACVRLSELALRTGPESLTGPASPYFSKLDEIEVDDGNLAFAVSGTALCRRHGAGELEAILCPGRVDELDLRGVSRIAPTACAGTYEIGTLLFDEAVAFVDGCGIAVNASCNSVVIVLRDFAGSLESVKLGMPSKGLQRSVFEATSGSGAFDLEAFLAAYDAALVEEGERLSQSMLMLARLANPIGLAEEARVRFEQLLAPAFDTLCVQFGARNYRQGFEDMADAGLLDADNVSRAVDVLAARGDATAVAWLLELKRERFGEGGFDYGL